MEYNYPLHKTTKRSKVDRYQASTVMKSDIYKHTLFTYYSLSAIFRLERCTCTELWNFSSSLNYDRPI